MTPDEWGIQVCEILGYWFDCKCNHIFLYQYETEACYRFKLEISNITFNDSTCYHPKPLDSACYLSNFFTKISKRKDDA